MNKPDFSRPERITQDERFRFHDIMQPPFEITGLPFLREDGLFQRIPQRIATEISERVGWLAPHTAGGMLRFRTDSRRLCLETHPMMDGSPITVNMSLINRSGTDVYFRRADGERELFIASVTPIPGEVDLHDLDIDKLKHAVGVLDFDAYTPDGSDPFYEVRIYFPNYDGIRAMYLGLDPDCGIFPPAPFAVEKPVVFYGSSITQGGCASHAGNNYTHILCRRLNANLINFGFSGAAQGEPLMAETVAALDMSAFVLDYDYNASGPEHLEKTHQAFYETVRAAHPEIPVIIMSHCDWEFTPHSAERKAVLRKTYETAKARGENVWFIDGDILLGDDERNLTTVDTIHPNDLGFYRMANAVEPVLREALGL